MSAERDPVNNGLPPEFNYNNYTTTTLGPRRLLKYNIDLSIKITAKGLALQEKDSSSALQICNTFFNKIKNLFKRTETEDNSPENVSLPKIAFADEADSNILVKGKALIIHEFQCKFAELVSEGKGRISLSVDRFLPISEEEETVLQQNFDQFETELMAALHCSEVHDQ